MATPFKHTDIENELVNMGIEVICSMPNMITFWFKEHVVTYYPKKQWATGKTITDGRGFNNLINQLKK